MATILIVDDQEANRQLLTAVLGSRGHALRRAENGREGLIAARAEPPDLVITDIVMPVMDGYEMVRAMRRDPALAGVRVIFCTANYLEHEVRQLADASGVRFLLPKDGNPQQMLSIVEAALAAPAPVQSCSDTDRREEDFGREHLRVISAKLAEKVREQEITQLQLQESEARFRTLSESSPVGIFSLDAEQSVTYSNPRLHQICGIPADGRFPTSWPALAHPDDAAVVDAEIQAAILARSSVRCRFRVVRPDGSERWVDLRVEPVLVGRSAAPFVGTVEDVTDLVQAQAQQAVLEARLRTVERLESVGQLAAGIAHDFNNLLAIMLNYAELVGESLDVMLAGLGDGKGSGQRLVEMRADVAEISGAAERAADLTRQLLLFGSRGTVHPELFDFNAVIATVEALLSRTLAEHVQLDVRLDSALWPVLGDPARAEQIVMNLFINARDAINGPGVVTVSTANLEIGTDDAGLWSVDAGRYVQVSVTDDGVGMSQDVLARAFEPFFTTKPKGQGTGLGLATVYGIVNQMHGRVTVDSEVGRGTVVQVLVPAGNDAGPARSTPDGEARAVAAPHDR